MYRRYASELFDRYMREHSDPRDLDAEQIEVVIDRLIRRRYDHTPANIGDVAAVIHEEFPKEKEMFRSGHQAPQQTQQPTQTRQEMHKVIADFLNSDWANCAPGTIPPIVDGRVASTVNRNAFDAALKTETTYGSGTDPVRRDILSRIVVELFARGSLERVRIVERVVEKVVEKQVPPSPEEVAKRHRELDRKMNAKDAPVFKTRNEQPKAATQEQILAEATKHADSDKAAQNIIAIIGNYRRKTRGSDAAEKELLENILAAGREAGTPWVKIEQQINAQIETMKGWDATEAIRRTMAEKAARKGIDLTKRTPNPYRQDGY